MIETSEILDLTDGTADRSNDDHHELQSQQQTADIIGAGHHHTLLPVVGQPSTGGAQSLVDMHDIGDITPQEEHDGRKTFIFSHSDI